MEKLSQWPAIDGLDKRRFFNDIKGRREALASNVHRMFVDSEVIDVEACVANRNGCKAEKLRNVKELQIYLDELETSKSLPGDAPLPATRVFFICQAHSRAKFVLSEQAMSLLFNRINVFPSFVNILTSFGAENGPCADGRSGFYERTARDSTGSLIFETAYTLKHVESKPGSDIPWSVRQMGLYQRYDSSTKQSCCLLIQTSARVQARIFDLVQDGGMAPLADNWNSLHEILLGTISNDWATYIKSLDVKIAALNFDVRFTKIGEENTENLSFDDLKKLSHYTDLLIRTSHALQLNITVLNNLSTTATKRAALQPKESAEEYEEFQNSIQICITEHEFLTHHVNLVRNSSERLAVLIRDSIALQDSNTMLVMTQRTISEAKTMKTITLVALVYLPASFTASFLSMNLIKVESLQGFMQLTVDPTMWFYFAITAPLMIVTFLAWWLWEYLMRRRARQREIEEGGKFKSV